MGEADSARALDLAGPAFDVRLEVTRRGAAELEKPAFGLSRNQRLLLKTISPTLSLRECSAMAEALDAQRLPRDAARLVAFGLVKVAAGELPQALLVEAMNLTQRIPIDRLRPLAPERNAVPMQPRVRQTRDHPVAAAEASDASRRGQGAWLLAMLLALSAFIAAMLLPR